MSMMVKYELKKVFSRTSCKIALILVFVIMGVTCFFAVDVSYMNENGESETGLAAVTVLREAQKEWAGYLDEEKIRQVIAENRRISESPEALSKDVRENNIAYSWGQGIRDIRNLLNRSYANGFYDLFDYYRADSLTEEMAGDFYENRTTLLKEWLSGAAKDQFSDAEKNYLISQYEAIQIPFYYDYMKGWTQLFEYAPIIIMITMLILGYLVSGIFPNEFTWKSDAVFFTSIHGRNKAVRAKIMAGFSIVTLTYFTAFLLYTGITLFYLGVDGWNLAVQVDWVSWRCFYNITVLQKYLLIIIGGYIGCLFISFLSMLVSAKTKSAVLAVMVPVVLIFIPEFLLYIDSPIVSKIISLLPDQLLQMGEVLRNFDLYSIGGKVFGEVPVIIVLYTVLTAIILPILYQGYRHNQIS